MPNPFAPAKRIVITRDIAIKMLVSVFPDLQQKWAAHVADYQNYAEDRNDYMDIRMVIVRYIMAKRLQHDTAGFQRFFNRLETIMIHGDDWTQELMSVGFLEDLIDACAPPIEYRTGFDEWLKPWSKLDWDGIINFRQEMTRRYKQMRAKN